MLTSIALILLLGLLMGTLLKKLRLPSLLGMIIVGRSATDCTGHYSDKSGTVS